ncbi:MAG: transcription termination factor Rho, partial [Gemmataceae bacterium]
MSSEKTSGQGVLELDPRGFGFLRSCSRGYQVNSQDPYVPAKLIKDFGLRQGLHLSGILEPARRGSGPRVAQLECIEGRPLSEYTLRPFESLTPVDPHVPLRLETGPEPLTTRVMDLFNPIGKGSRGLIVAPPRT